MSSSVAQTLAFSGSLSPNMIILAGLVSAAIFLVYNSLNGRRYDAEGHPVPDGPIGLPIVGSFPFLTHYPELTLDYWTKKFGSLYSFYLGNQLSYMSRCVDGYTNVLDYEATVLIRDLYKFGKAGQVPINPQPHAGRCSLNNMLTVTFGTRTDDIKHPMVAEALRMPREFMNCTGPVSNLTDFVPLLQKIPGNYMVKRAQKLHDDLVKTYGGMILDIQARMKRGEEVPDCLVKNMIETKEEEDMDHLDMSILCSAFMIGGVETTASIMQWFSALIPSYPHIQAKAHEELDRVVGRNRLPTVEDEKNLPFIHAIIKEVERCHNPFWLGTPHTNTQDFVYDGKFIPKNTVLVLNTVLHNARRHENPEVFDPERYIRDPYLSSESANLPDANERDHWMFGAGRRICPGMWVAEREIFLVISRLLWAFKMETIPGEPIDLKEYDGLSGRSPVPFRIKMIPRHDKVAEVLEL
ncbi:hypothetical protein AX16_010511 [Volvariella volvacea WC 439]|nr:hypothetical protein AX16_010511 [Volvariella volvacea WC 439]